MSKSDYLTDYSERDKPWDAHRAQTDDVGGIYQAAAEFERYAERMASSERFEATDAPPNAFAVASSSVA